MTREYREYAKSRIEYLLKISSFVFDEHDREALEMAIKALSQEPCTDAVSREKAKQFLYERLDRLNDDELYDIFSRIIDDMYNELPSVNPKPCDDAISQKENSL